MPKATRSKHRLPTKLSTTVWIATAVFIFAMLETLVFTLSSGVSIRNATYALPGTAPQAFDFPLKLDNAPSADISIQFTMHVGRWHPTHFEFSPDDCVQSILVNGIGVNDPQLPFCDFSQGRVVDLSSALSDGDNALLVVIHNNGGGAGLMVTPYWLDITSFLPLSFFVIFCISYVLFLAHVLRKPAWQTGTILLILFGSALRLFYVLVTPYWIRGHDTDGHIQYIQFIHDHWALPMPDAGWEFWQPPLYYLIGAVWMRFMDIFQLDHQTELFTLQLLSLVFSIFSMVILVWIAKMMLPAEEKPVGLPIFTCITAVFPALLLQASRINNDTLSVLLAIAALGCLVAWWKSGNNRPWILLSVFLGLGLLTKNTGLLLIPVAYLCLLARKRWSWKKKIGFGVLSIVLISLIAGWFTVYRIVHNPSQSLIIGNNRTLSSGLDVPNSMTAFTTFNPAAVLQIPYNDAWNDASRRQYFWEYWYRSAFFGEFSFGDDRKLLASWMLLLGFMLMVLMLFGIWRALSKKTTIYAYLPLLIALPILLLGHLIFRIEFPYSSSQDFRYSVPLLVPCIFFVTLGVTGIRNVLWKEIAIITVSVFFACTVIFFAHS